MEYVGLGLGLLLCIICHFETNFICVHNSAIVSLLEIMQPDLLKRDV
jgi:hypothetical protein